MDPEPETEVVAAPSLPDPAAGAALSAGADVPEVWLFRGRGLLAGAGYPLDLDEDEEATAGAALREFLFTFLSHQGHCRLEMSQNLGRWDLSVVGGLQ